jgi:hypothetical protein
VTDREILAAALRWHTAHEVRLSIGATKRRNEKSLKEYGDAQFNTYAPTYRESCRIRTAASDAAEQLTPAKSVELAALRELAKVCARVRGNQKQVDDANEVIDVEVKLLSG